MDEIVFWVALVFQFEISLKKWEYVESLDQTYHPKVEKPLFLKKLAKYVPYFRVFPGGGFDYFLLLIGKSSIWFTKKHFLKVIIYSFNTLKCAANYVI